MEEIKERTPIEAFREKFEALKKQAPFHLEEGERVWVVPMLELIHLCEFYRSELVEWCGKEYVEGKEKNEIH